MGSPPRVRGKENLVQIAAALLRITPACAGKSSTQNANLSSGRDHPRVCGEKYNQAMEGYVTNGSPPRVRGKDILLTFLYDSSRITPACAGKSWGLYPFTASS